MKFSPALAVAAATTVIASPSHPQKRDGVYAAPADQCILEHLIPVQYLRPVVINQYFENNASIIINGGLTININNAPVSLSTTMTGTFTSTSTSTTTATTTSTALPLAQSFNLQFSSGPTKRQTGSSFIGSSGSTVSDCSDATVYSISATGELSSSEGTISAVSGATDEIFAALSTSTGDITTTFSLSGTTLTWAYPSFDNGEAAFCLLQNIVYVYFSGSDPNCVPITLTAIAASSCGANPVSVTSSSASSSTTVSVSLVTPTTHATTTTGASTSSSSSSSVASSTTSGSGSTTTNSAFINSVLNQHNIYRANNNAPAMTWSPAAAAFAQTVASKCAFEHSGGPYGENLAIGTGITNPAYFVYLWYAEQSSYNFKNPDPSTFESWGHFSQLVWVGSTSVGCALQTGCAPIEGVSPGGNYLVCEYDPPGNYIDQTDLAANVLPPKSQTFNIPSEN